MVNDLTIAWVHGCIPAVGVRHIGEPDLEWGGNKFVLPTVK